MRQTRYRKAESKAGAHPHVSCAGGSSLLESERETCRVKPVVVFFLFSLFLMIHTFGYDGRTHTILIASKLWSDFAAHVPLIRSFSMGSNWPPEYPLFPGEPIRYHFLFYALVGFLEKAGLPLDWALNLPSAIGFTLLLWGIWSLAKSLFGDARVAALSILFFLFNGSLSFLQFFRRQPLTLATFPAFGPWDGGVISAFWNLNIYTNQRHLAPAFAIGLFFIYWVARANTKLFRPQQGPPFYGESRTETLGGAPWAKPVGQAILWGLAIGLLPSFHQPMLPIFAMLLSWYFLVFPHMRLPLALTGIPALLLIVSHVKLPTSNFSWYPGYLIHDRLTLVNFLSYWFQNLGLHAILIPVGFFFLPNRVKKVLMPLFFIFTVGNLFTFSPEVAANHKFFNFALLLGNMITAYAILSLARKIGRIGSIGLLVALVVLLTLSGVIDFLVIAADPKGAIPDVGNNKAATWIARNTPRDAVFLNSSFLYHPASLAGRKIFLGWPYFAWSAGYDTRARMADMKTMYESRDPAVFCPLLTKYDILYVTVEDTKNDPNLPTIDAAHFRRIATPAFADERSSLTIYTTRALCGR